MSNGYVSVGQFWRLVTTSFVSGQLLGVLMNLLVLWLAGRALESELGSWRFALLFLASGFGGATLFFLLAPSSSWSVGAASAIVGLLAANTIGKAKTGEDVRPDIGLLVLLVLYAVLVGFSSFGWVSLIGGIIVGGVSGAILAYAPRQNRMAIQLVGMLALVAVCLGLVVTKIAL
jgi:membrane associated rhomboid family serine protease